MKITEDVRKFAAQQQISEDEALQVGMEQKAREFVENRQRNLRSVRSTSFNDRSRRRERVEVIKLQKSCDVASMSHDFQMSSYTPDPTELKTRASLFWPKELITEHEKISIIPLLIKTQDRFISILDVADRSPESWKAILRETEGLPANLFLKHLMVLTDVGGEPLKRLRPELARMFPDGKMIFEWKGKKHSYVFQKILSTRTLNNSSLFVDGESLATGHDLDAATEDVVMLLMFGSAATNASLPQDIAEKCMIGSLIGRKPEVQKFVKQRYIFVSRITSGARANSLGQLAQDYVRDVLKESLSGWTITRNGRIAGISQNAGGTDMTFDLVAKSPTSKYFAIEVSYQVTTNSTIERKAGQAETRAQILHRANHKICYVIDGAGNFERDAALRTICRFSDCTVAFTPREVERLVDYLKQADGARRRK